MPSWNSVRPGIKWVWIANPRLVLVAYKPTIKRIHFKVKEYIFIITQINSF